jgi:hypothetical protein
MPRLVVVLPLTPLDVGAGFAVSAWPLHVTVLPPFLTDAPADRIASAIGTATSTLSAMTVVAGGNALFGRRHDIPVTLIEPDEELAELHSTLVRAIRPFAEAPDEPAFTGPGFRGHVTHKPPARVDPGDIITLEQIALVDMLPRADAAGRTVLAAFPLSRSTPV